MTSDSANVVIHLAIEAPDAKTLPVLVEVDGSGRPTVSLSVAMYARYLLREGVRSYETIRKYVAAISCDAYIPVVGESSQKFWLSSWNSSLGFFAWKTGRDADSWVILNTWSQRCILRSYWRDFAS